MFMAVPRMDKAGPVTPISALNFASAGPVMFHGLTSIDVP
jgi:hypothetical protein